MRCDQKARPQGARKQRSGPYAMTSNAAAGLTGTSETVARGRDGRCSGWNARSRPKRMVDPLREAGGALAPVDANASDASVKPRSGGRNCKADRPNSPVPSGCSPMRRLLRRAPRFVVPAMTFVARLAFIRIGPCSAAAWEYFRDSLGSSQRGSRNAERPAASVFGQSRLCLAPAWNGRDGRRVSDDVARH
jgi:hypothetical protein